MEESCVKDVLKTLHHLMSTPHLFSPITQCLLAQVLTCFLQALVTFNLCVSVLHDAHLCPIVPSCYTYLFSLQFSLSASELSQNILWDAKFLNCTFRIPLIHWLYYFFLFREWQVTIVWSRLLVCVSLLQICITIIIMSPRLWAIGKECLKWCS